MIKLTPKQIEIYKTNECKNYHTENLVFLAEIIGGERIIKLTKLVQEIHNVEGCMPYHISLYKNDLLTEIGREIDLTF